MLLLLLLKTLLLGLLLQGEEGARASDASTGTASGWASLLPIGLLLLLTPPLLTLLLLPLLLPLRKLLLAAGRSC